MSDYRIVLYGNGLFASNSNPSRNQTQLTQLQQSGFNTIILWTIHVHPDGSLYYNDAVIVQNGEFSSSMAFLPPLVSALRAPVDGRASTIETVLFSIGSGDVSDFANIQALLSTDEGRQTLHQNFKVLSATVAIDGYDFDDEDNYDTGTIAGLTELLCTPNPVTITYCPYEASDFWAGCLPVVYNWDQQQSPVPYGQSVQWFNLQCYGGGSLGNIPTFTSSVSGVTSSAGIGNPYSFIVPGIDAGYYPYDVETTFLYSIGSAVGGGFLWNSSQIFGQSYYAASDYANAIISGLTNAAAARAGQPATPRRKRRKQPAGGAARQAPAATAPQQVNA